MHFCTESSLGAYPRSMGNYCCSSVECNLNQAFHNQASRTAS
jgi:hypothetical protein